MPYGWFAFLRRLADRVEAEGDLTRRRMPAWPRARSSQDGSRAGRPHRAVPLVRNAWPTAWRSSICGCGGGGDEMAAGRHGASPGRGHDAVPGHRAVGALSTLPVQVALRESRVEILGASCRGPRTAQPAAARSGRCATATGVQRIADEEHGAPVENEAMTPTEARWRTSKAIRNGDLVRQPCEVCGTTRNINAHHDDYEKPLEVRWLCASHHVRHHRPRKIPRKVEVIPPGITKRQRRYIVTGRYPDGAPKHLGFFVTLSEAEAELVKSTLQI